MWTLWPSKINKKEFSLEIYPYQKLITSNMCTFYHMLAILNFIPYGLPKVLTLSSRDMVERRITTSSHRNLCFGELPMILFYFNYKKNCCDAPVKLSNWLFPTPQMVRNGWRNRNFMQPIGGVLFSTVLSMWPWKHIFDIQV